MIVEKIFDDLFTAQHVVLSAIAFQGYRQTGKGAIPLALNFFPQPDDRYSVRMGIQTYQNAAYFQKLAWDRSFYNLLLTYNPATTGIVVFSLQPMNRAGYFQFSLTPAAVQRAYLLN